MPAASTKDVEATAAFQLDIAWTAVKMTARSDIFVNDRTLRKFLVVDLRAVESWDLQHTCSDTRPRRT